MAKDNSTLDFRTTQVNSPITRNILVLETVTEPTKKVRNVGLTFSPVQLELCIVLRGKWLSDMGFKKGQKLTAYAEHNLLQITALPTDDE